MINMALTRALGDHRHGAAYSMYPNFEFFCVSSPPYQWAAIQCPGESSLGKNLCWLLDLHHRTAKLVAVWMNHTIVSMIATKQAAAARSANVCLISSARPCAAPVTANGAANTLIPGLFQGYLPVHPKTPNHLSQPPLLWVAASGKLHGSAIWVYPTISRKDPYDAYEGWNGDKAGGCGCSVSVMFWFLGHIS